MVFLLISVAYFTHAERKILSAIQRRRSPNVIGFLQSLSDGLKLLTNEQIPRIF
jgi:NADH-quinone oxidoreductase subunit H